MRLRLQWSVYVTRNGGTHPLRSKTRDLSSHGFYCVLPERLTAGEHIECDLVIPTHVSRSADDVLFLRCQARVVRVETRDPGEGHGLACQIEDYCLIPKTTREDPPPSPWNGTKLV
ncbi:MAG: PilZ domain-containing protein [Acidobacteriia bacterium]|nr:PilZ domain-containing protein [Terriglobia bacterium]